jgi:hypothetical protein
VHPLRQRRGAERDRRQAERDPAEHQRAVRQRGHDRQREEEREPDAVQDVDAEDPPRLAQEREPHPVHQSGDDQHLAQPPQRLAQPGPPRSSGGAAHLNEREGEPRGEDERRRHQPVDPLQPHPERSRAQLGPEERQRVGLDHDHHGDAAEPVERLDAGILRHGGGA